MREIKQTIWASSALVVLVALGVGFALPQLWAGEASAPDAAQTVAADEKAPAPAGDRWALALGAAGAVGISCLAAGYAVAHVGAAALGAASERPELLGRSLILVGLAEGIAIYGLIFGIMLLQKF